MRVLMGFFVMAMIVMVLAVAALVQLVIALLPYLAVALVVVLVLRLRRRRNPTPPAMAYPGAQARVRAAGQRSYRVGAPVAAPEGWVLVPVWVAPARPDPTVIDAEVINDHG